ncbi:Carbamoyl-phosphate synthase large chain [Bienertia sinuspersici]
MANEEWIDNFDKERVTKVWQTNIIGTAKFRVVQKLKIVKGSLKKLNKTGFSDIQAAVIKAYQQLAQQLRRKRKAKMEYKERHGAYMQFLRKKPNSNG